MATAPGSRGAKKVLEIASNDMRRKGGDIVAIFSLPSIWENFSETAGISNAELNSFFDAELFKFKDALPNATLDVIPFCGHVPQEEKPEETARLIVEFLSYWCSSNQV